MEKYICIHGHFYQPPRENAWLEAVEVQDSAFPYHDWNERVTAESYAPNATARIMDDRGRIERMVNNYARISFNFGPTLLAWMQVAAPEIHAAIVEADRESRKRFSGHGSAMAQAYNHMIMPLANERDKRTQVLWGIRDFEFRFGRAPEGMWLPETAADLHTLDALAAQGIRFTILSPYQARRTRRTGSKWREVHDGAVDPSMPYEVRLPSGRRIAVFFYDGPISQAVAFEQLLRDGKTFALRIADAFDDDRARDQLVHLATDGESYGHHHPKGEMALAYALEYIERAQIARLTNYGEYLERHPPTHEAEIHEKSAWSCAHGVGRWWRDCGCSSGAHPDWNQGWRTPLRGALDWLRDQLAPKYEAGAKTLLKNPWIAREDYIAVILDRSPESLDRFFHHHQVRPLSDEERINAVRLLECQRHAMLMYTSCGWFFDDLSGIETVQVIQYAGRAIQLAQDFLHEDFEAGFLEILERAECNAPQHGNGRTVYEQFVKPTMMNREKVAAHFAVSSLFENYPEKGRIYAFTIDQQDRQLLTAGRAQLACGRIKVTFEITRGSDTLTYCVLHFGDHNLNGGVCAYDNEETFLRMKSAIGDAFSRADFPEVIRLMDRFFGESHYSLKSLFRDEQRKVLNQILQTTMAGVEASYRQIADTYTPLMRFLGDLGVPLPRPLQVAENFVLNAEMREQFAKTEPDLERIRVLLTHARNRFVPLEMETLQYTLKGTLDSLMERFTREPDQLEWLKCLANLAGVLPELPFDVNLWKTQNLFYSMIQTALPKRRQLAQQGDPAAKLWIDHFKSLGARLGFRTTGLSA